MNVRIIKEARTLLPTMGVTLLLMVVPFLIWGRQSMGFGLFVLGFGFVVMGAISFGSEFQHRTMPLLLSQPIRRTTLWQEKLTVLGASFGIGLLIYFLCVLTFDASIFREADAPTAAQAIILTAFCAFCTTPFWTLAVRNTLAGAVFSVVIPVAILCLVAGGEELLGRVITSYDSRIPQFCAIGLIAIYSILFFLAWVFPIQGHGNPGRHVPRNQNASLVGGKG